MGNDYAQRLRAALSDHGWSQQDLVRYLAEQTGNALESERSSVRSYLSGAKPSPKRAKIIAEGLKEPDLARVDGSRQTVASVVGDHLEGLEAVLGSLQVGQQRAADDLEALLREVRDLRKTLDERLPSSSDASKRRRSR
jgi:transcriptional regulator with XRE-family HTH domain